VEISIHIPDQVLAQLATLIAERLSEYGDLKLGAYLNAPEAEAIPAPAEVQEVEPAVVKEVEAAPVEPNPTYTRDDLTAALIKMGKKRGRSGIQEVFEICGFDSAKDVPDDKIGEVIKLVEEML
jgi:hypothetical protein